MSLVRIVTDSTSDVPPDVAERLHITVVPAYVQIGDRSYRDDASVAGLSREEFYARLPTQPVAPTTSVPPIVEFTNAYRTLSGETDEVVAIMVSGELSGMVNLARLGAQEVTQLNVHVVDSGQVSMGLGWIAIAAAEAAASGQSAREILSLVYELKKRVRVFAVLDTLEYLRRSGRVSWTRAKAAQILHIRPIVSLLLGKVRDLGQTRSRHRAIERLVELTRALGPLERLAVLHTYGSGVEELRHRLADLCSPVQMLTVAVTTIIGAHVGPQGLGVAAVVAS